MTHKHYDLYLDKFMYTFCQRSNHLEPNIIFRLIILIIESFLNPILLIILFFVSKTPLACFFLEALPFQQPSLMVHLIREPLEETLFNLVKKS